MPKQISGSSGRAAPPLRLRPRLSVDLEHAYWAEGASSRDYCRVDPTAESQRFLARSGLLLKSRPNGFDVLGGEAETASAAELPAAAPSSETRLIFTIRPIDRYFQCYTEAPPRPGGATLLYATRDATDDDEDSVDALVFERLVEGRDAEKLGSPFAAIALSPAGPGARRYRLRFDARLVRLRYVINDPSGRMAGAALSVVDIGPSPISFSESVTAPPAGADSTRVFTSDSLFPVSQLARTRFALLDPAGRRLIEPLPWPGPVALPGPEAEPVAQLFVAL